MQNQVISPWVVYVITRLDALSTPLLVFASVGAVVAVIAGIIWCVQTMDESEALGIVEKANRLTKEQVVAADMEARRHWDSKTMSERVAEAHERSAGAAYLARRAARAFKLALFVSLASTALHVVTPTTREACAILLIPKIANNEDVQGVAVEVRDLAREWIKALGPKEGK